MAGTTVGKLNAVLTADGTGFTSVLNASSRHAQSFKSALTGILGSIGVGLSLGALVGFSKSAFEAIDAAFELASGLGTTTESLIGLQHAAGKSNISAETLNTTLGMMVKNLGDAAIGGGPVADAINRIGLNVNRLATIDPADAFMEISDALAAIPNDAERASIAQDIFGRSSMQMLNFLKQGSAAMREGTAEAKRFGIAVSQTDAAKIDAAGDAMGNVGAALKGIATQFVVSLAPSIERGAQAFSEWAANGLREGGELRLVIDEIAAGLNILGKGVAALAGLFTTAFAKAVEFKDAVAELLGLQKAPALRERKPESSFAGGNDATRQRENALSVAAATAKQKELNDALKYGEKLLANSADDEYAKGLNAINALLLVGKINEDEYTKQLIKLERAYNDATTGSGRLIDRLQFEIDTFGMSADEIAIRDLKLKGAKDSEIEFAESLLETKKAMEATEEASQFRKNLYDDTRTDTEKAIIKLLDLNAAFENGTIGFDLYSRGVDQVRKSMEDLNRVSLEPAPALELGSREAFLAMQPTGAASDQFGLDAERNETERQQKKLLEELLREFINLGRDLRQQEGQEINVVSLPA